MIKRVADLRRIIRNVIKPDHREDVNQRIEELCVFLQSRKEVGRSIKVLEEELTCRVCLEVVVEACVTTCNHVFCKFCLEMSIFETRKACPLCGTYFLKSSPLRLLPEVDGIVDITMTHDNTIYIFEARDKIMERNAVYAEKTAWRQSEFTRYRLYMRLRRLEDCYLLMKSRNNRSLPNNKTLSNCGETTNPSILNNNNI